jgi:choline/glycine/proline betaine transport protein
MILVMCFSLYKGLDEDYKKLKKESQKKNYEEIVSELVKNKIVISKTKINNHG